ncbi:mucin-2-like [Chelonoidis abingdonii]|uniref:mucin-2-like n=1 Tax=Chelonoidis abingdonii TaxID=106734 RepID=UPI003F4931E8
MGFGQGLRVSIWAFMLGVCCAQQQAFTTNTPSGTVNFIPPLTTSPEITSFNPAHNDRVCSTWGNFHFKTFDGVIFYFPGLCNYVFASHCNAAYEDFNIQIRRAMVKNAPTINHITMKLDGVVFEMAKKFLVVNGNRVQLPYSQSGIMAERSSTYTKVTAKLGLVFMWNEDDSILLELSDKYANYTCGLCGDFNGIPTYNEFFSNNAKLTATQFGNMQKMDGPTEVCEDPTSSSLNNCTGDIDDICHKVLTGSAFSECNTLVEVSEYIKSCEQDLCRCDQSKNAFCICNTFGEYSRQCAHAGGKPLNWRTPQLCPKKCPFNMDYQECGSPCIDTCTNLERAEVCEDHCIDGCFCPAGTVLDDINNAGCIPLRECFCTYNGNSYAPGTSFDANCRSCTCNGGLWNCKDIPCPGSCTVEGGSHISTYDEKRYNVHGDCTYVLSKLCENDAFAVLGELRGCGMTDTMTCLKTIHLSINGGQTIIKIISGGGVFVNWIYTQLPFSAADVTIFRPSSFFIVVETNFGLQLEIQLVPIMQAFVRLDPSFKGQTCGLCGNFNNIENDDFKAISGVVEGTAAAFANTWKTQASCLDIKNNFENPCSLSVENEKYAQHWCGLLTDSTGPFANCHSTVKPAVYHTNCLFDTCNCAKSEDCMCAALSSYVRACAAKGVQLEGWRTDVCSKYTTSCPKSLSYSYNINSCQPTCRSLSEPDVTCNIRFIPVDGCTCGKGTYMDDYGKCVSASECPCYYKGSPILSGEVVHEDGLVCTCAQGKLSCIGSVNEIQVCASPMVYFDCRNVTAGTTGAECQKSCQTLDMHCYSTQCMSGCICPSGLVSDGKGSCIAEEECPCIHNEATYKPGEEIKVDCNTCVCKNRMWKCTSEQCLGTCAIYGDGHYITFDDKRFNFNGDCEYTLVQDHCGKNSTVNGTFRVVTENIPCGSTGTTCSKSIKVFLAGHELILSEEHLEVVERENGRQMPYQVRYMGMYLVIETNNGLILMWNKKTSVLIKLSPDFKGQVCGLCGNYDGNGINDFTTRTQSVVGDVLEFGNSWKVSLACPVANTTKDPCSTNPYRKSWSQRQCSIINSEVFAACHSQIEPTKYYEACVTDACACDSGGDCECFCTAVAAYAQACSEFGVCVAWRTPSICPVFCDYYNPEGECEWHYKPCGAPCMKTCRNPSGRCLHKLPGLEGCYPNCPANKPYFNEDEMTCVDNCGCYDAEGNYYKPGVSFYSQDNCQSCTCTVEGLECEFDAEACYCYYEDHKYKYKDVIYNTTDGIGGCLSATCDINGTITRKVFECSGITTTIPFTFSTVLPTSAAETTTTPPVTTVCVHNICQWSEWYDVSSPTTDKNNGDFETFENIRANGYRVCETPSDVECRAESNSSIPLKNLKQKMTCSKDFGLICNNEDQTPEICYNYQIRILCCTYVPCESTTSIPSVTTSGHPTVTVTSLESKTVSRPTASISTEGPTPFPLPTTSSITPTLVPPVSTTVSVTSTASSPTPGKGTRSAASTLPSSEQPTTEGTTLLSTQPTSQESRTTLLPPVSTTISVTSTASPPTPGIATGSRSTATLPTGTIPPLTATRPQPSPASTLPSSEQPTTEGTTLLSTEQISEASTTTLLSPVSTTISVTSTRPQPSPRSTLPPLEQPTTEGTTLLSMQPTSERSTTTLVSPVSTSVSITSTASPPTPGTGTGSAGTAPLQTGTIPPVTGTRGEMTTYSASIGKSSTVSGSTMLLSTSPVQSTSQGSTTRLLSSVSSTVAVSPTLSIRTLATSTISRLTSSISTTTEGSSIAYTAHDKSTSFTSSRVTPCLCHVSGRFFSPGEVIYNRTDNTGCSFYALCSKRCEIERLQGSCPTTTPVSLSLSSTIPSLSTPTAISSSVPATPETIPISGCPDADPPRKMNESWMLNNCTMATCEGDNRIVLLLPPAVEMITCESGLPPIKVYDEDGCNYHYECDCVCSGWSSSDYLTFDGTHYTFHGNCTYVLMKQIVPKYNFSILVENDLCDVPDGLSCPRSIIVNYNSMEIVLVSQIHQGEKNNKHNGNFGDHWETLNFPDIDWRDKVL